MSSDLSTPNRRFLLHGFLPAFCSACCFALMASLIKLASAELPASVLVFMRNVVGLIIILPIVLPRGLVYLKTGRLRMHMLRGFISLCAMTCFFYAIAHVGLAEATLLNAASPLFIGILATLLLNEQLSRSKIIALIIGFIGVALILKPGTQLFTIAALIGLASGFFIGCAKILIRMMSSTEPVLRTVFYFSIFSCLYSTIPLIWFWQSPSTDAIILMILAGISATAGQTLLTYAFTHNEATRIAPFTYVTVLMATLIGWLGWNELPDIGSSIGAILVIISCLVITMQGKLLQVWKRKQPTINP